MSRATAFISVLLFVSACQFEFEREFFDDTISPVSDTFITVNLEDMPDTLLVLQQAKVNYKLDIEGGPWFVVYKVLDDTAEFLGYSLTGSFTVKNNPHRTHSILEVVALATSATGSLADKNFRELMLFGTSRVLRFDNTPPVPIHLETKIEDGTIVVTWPKYPEENLLSWRLKKSIYRSGSIFQTLNVALDRTDTVYREDSFLADKIVYQMTSANSFGKEAVGDTALVNVRPPRIMGFTPAASGYQVLVTWDRGDMYSNISGYEIAGTTISDPQATQIAMEPPLGSIQGFNLRVKSKSSLQDHYIGTPIWLGEQTIQAIQMLKDPSRDRLFFFGETFVARYENGLYDSLEVAFNQWPAFHLSADGNTLYAGGGGHIFAINTSTMSVEATHTYSPGSELYSLTTAGDFIYLLCRGTDTSSRLVAYNMSTGVSTLNQFHQTLDVRQIVSSPDGQHLITSGVTQMVHKVIGDGTVELVTHRTDQRSSWAMFISSNEYVTVYKTVEEPSLMQYRRFSVPDGAQLSWDNGGLTVTYVDAVNGRALARIGNQLAVLDLRTKEMNFWVRTAQLPDELPVLLSGNYIYRNGFLLKYPWLQ